MLSYATIFIGSVILAVVALVLYRVISGTSRSVLSTKTPINASNANPEFAKSGAFGSIRDTAFPSGHTSHASPKNTGKTFTAMPVEDNADWSVREKSSHCSLYDVDAVEALVQNKRNRGWPQREDRQEAGGNAYKVTRKASTDTTSAEDSGKPWGW